MADSQQHSEQYPEMTAEEKEEWVFLLSLFEDGDDETTIEVRERLARVATLEQNLRRAQRDIEREREAERKANAELRALQIENDKEEAALGVE
ncbi:hypothetical protein ANO11243_019040 [Dothideomycetidae sp. 11243]|nr:hypothetical protein ANO11243_019040 [fungal sp. No.11243]